MLYDLHNLSRAPRIFYDGAPLREIRIDAGQTLEAVELTEFMAAKLVKAAAGLDECLTVSPHDPNRQIVDATAKPAIVLDGRYGIGDAIHQRGPIRELMRDHEVWLSTCHFRVYEDLVERGLKLIFKNCSLHAQRKTIERERAFFPHAPAPPAAAPRFNLSYNKDLIDKHGSIVEAMAGCVGVKAKPLDFSLPVRPEWVAEFKRRFDWDTGGRPIMVYRPIVLRREWNGANRNPDPAAYAALFNAVRDGFYVVSVAHLERGVEWIVDSDQPADQKLHNGELTFEDMAALWSSAALVFGNAGFAPVLAQAVGTPSITVYGGRECYRTTQRAGEHLAPSLGVDPDTPCDCMSERHSCPSRKITLPPALDRAKAFAEKCRRAAPTPASSAATAPGSTGPSAEAIRPRDGVRTLIFATTYVDSGDREILTRQWLDLHTALNPECDILMVDSASPKPVLDEKWSAQFKADPKRFHLYDFGDNIGHLSRKGRDGWGRAFCLGLDYAVEHGYEYVLHIEGDSLLRTPAREIVASLKRSRKGVASITVRGTHREIPGWVETGLMCFSTVYLKKSRFTATYDWTHREVRPTPEFVVFRLVAPDMLMLDLKGLRGDKNQISAANIVAMDLDWVTHCHSDIWVYEKFVAANLIKMRQHNYEVDTKPEQAGNRGGQERTVAVVVGGAVQVIEEIAATEALLAEAGVEARWLITNDMIGRFPRPCTAVTLHPHKIAGWLAERRMAGYPKPDEIWAHIKHDGVTHWTDDWRGSSGLFAVKVALKLGYQRVILAGVPMDPNAGHVVRGAVPWRACDQFMGGWRLHQKDITPFVRSWSGWTGATFGPPDQAFIGAPARAA